MVDNVFSEAILTRLLADLLVKSQRFVRAVENNDYCVSLRDVDRCRKLVQWFDKFLLKKNHINSDRDRKVRAIILGLAICYHSRFPEGNKRKNYRQEVQRCLCSMLSYKITEDDILNHILTEQKDILNLMTELPPGTALNTALQENVFMLLVCILNKIPIFLVGKPGCSKSLSMQLIRSNLRGKDSSTPLFQDMPQLFCVSFQGSESSTSDGIIKVFEKAEKYQLHNDERDVLSVVILDEIGLAEISKFNPLKVLHGLIERQDEQLKVAVVGISNWALDAAKMNRAIHLSRPDMDLDDLIYTGKSISESMIPSQEVGAFSLDKKHTSDQQADRTELLEGIAKAYNEYYLHELKFPNFHGLRDFYSLIKYLGRNIDIRENTDSNEVCEVILTGILRNFGGLPTEKNKILEIFRKYTLGITLKEIPVIKLIVENIRDNSCRHLMLITNGDAVISILENQLNELRMPFDIIFGSRFEDDLTDAYNYRILSRIILCMEQGMVLILKDLESIYGSLYDMLNQNYTVVGKKKHCRVALGHYSNPMCQVHDNFKCVVLVEESKLDYSDPPFLNRFEKQQVTFSDFLDKESMKEAVDELDREMVNFCTIPDHSFSPYDLIPSYSQNLLISLLIRSQQLVKCTPSIATVKQLAFDTLLWLIPPEVIIRSTESVFSKSKTPSEINQTINKYIKLPIHNGLCHYFDILHFESTDKVEQTDPADDILKKETDSDTVDAKYLDIAQCTLIDTQKTDNPILDETKLIEEDTDIENEIFTNSFKEQTQVWEEKAQLNLFADKEMASGYDSNERKGKLDSCAYLNVVNTFSGINALIDTSSQWQKLQREKMAIFRSEKQFSLTVEEFFKSDNNIFLLHCINSTESQHLLLVKGIIEKHIRTQKIDLCKEGKYICIVVHLERKGSNNIPLTFLSGWRLLFIDSIRTPRTFLEQFRSVDQVQIVSERRPLDDYIRNMILWAFSRINFTSKHISVQTIEDLITRMKSSSEIITTIEAYIISWITKRSFGYDLQNFGSTSWCFDVAKNPYELLKAGSFIDALEHSIQEIIRLPLTLFIFKLVEQNLLNPLFVEDASTPERKLIWKQMVLSGHYISTDDIPPPSGPECYLCSSDPLNFYMPCSQLLMMQIDSRKNEYLAIIGRIRIDNSIDPDEEMPKDLFENTTTSCIDFICHEAFYISEEFTYTDRNKDFIRDFCNYNSFAILSETNELQRINIFKWALSNFIDLGKLENADFLCLVSNMHAGLWVYGQVINAICELVNLLIRSIDISILPIPAMSWFKEFVNEASYFVTQNNEIQHDNEHLSISCNDSSEMNEYELKTLNNVSTHDVESSNISDSSGTANNSYIGANNKPSRNNENDMIARLRDAKMQPGCDMIQNKSSSMSREQLVKHVCLSLLPTREVLKDLDINEWLCLIRNVLPLAQSVHDDSCELTALKFCQDLVDVSVVNQNIPVTDINDLGHCILECNGNLDSTNVCKSPGNTEPLKFVLREITRKTFLDQTLKYFGQVVKFAVIIDLSENMDIYVNMLKDEDSFEDEENFSFCFDYYLTNLVITNTDNLSLPILLLDTLEHYAFDEYLTIENLKSVDSSSNEILQCLSQSCQIMETADFCLKFIVALAFIRKFMALFVDLLESTKYNCCTFPILSQHINSAMDVSTKSGFRELISSEILHLFMKHIDHRMGHQHIQKICRRVESYIPVFTNVQWETKYVEKSSVFNPLFLHLDKECFNLFITHINCVGHKNNKLNGLLLEKNGIWNFVCVLAQSCFMSKCLRERNDSETQVAEQISNLVQKLQITDEIKNLINKMLGRMNFKHNIFNLSVMVESPQTQIISVIIHLACIVGNVASHDNFWYQLIMKPRSIASCNVPYTMFKNVHENESSNEFSVIPNVVGHILQFLLHGSLVLSSELETISLEDVKNSVGFDCGDIQDYLEMQLQQYWQSLENVLQLNSNDLCILLHSILFKSLNLFTVKHQCEDVEDAYTRFMTDQECRIHQIVMERYIIIQESKQHSASLYDKSETSIENCVLEITPCQSSSNMTFVTQLFRVYKKPSKLIMLSDLHMKTKKEFPFLRLVIENLDKLCLPQKMLSILKWHLTLVTYVSNKYRKVDFKDVTVSKLIADEHDDKRREVLKLSFESFKNDWNEIRSRHWQLLNTEDTILLESMQPMTKMNYAAICGEKSQLQIVINSLAKIQNNFLCLAHSLKSIKETPKTVPLLDVRSKDLLRFEWNDHYLQFSQCDSRYGFSQKIDFDYEKIEQEMQAEVLFGKCFIDVKVLPKITFTDDLFRNTIELLKELQSNLDQYPLTSDIKKEVEQKSERDASQISDLLTHTGIVLSLIRKTGAQSEQPISEYLQRWETVFGISSLESNIFPEEIKIGHIITFYQWLEELNGENLANSLGDTYRMQLPREGRDCLLRFSKGNMKSIEKLAHAVKVFVHRCLSSSDNVIRPDQSLIDYLCDEHFWWKDDFENGYVLCECEHLRLSLKELLSPAIQVEHICEALQCIMELLEDSKQKDARAQGISIGYQTTGLNELPKRARSKAAAKKFMKT
ncbi:RNF213 [Mytilus edulis]|uniref:RNF213 n=1 Tax=Mytilus edulis TaxID=6550 RepID=A0A8S3RM53_MYTED|nr:RNF213 [Mytilus edulis]